MCGSIKSKQSTLGQRLLQMPPVTFVQLVSASKIAVETAAPSWGLGSLRFSEL